MCNIIYMIDSAMQQLHYNNGALSNYKVSSADLLGQNELGYLVSKSAGQQAPSRLLCRHLYLGDTTW